jgi:hypothetical protein
MDTSDAVYISPEFMKRKPNSEPGKLSAEDWEQMMRALYAYRLGGMSFLDLLTAWEDILGIAHPPTTDQL